MRLIDADRLIEYWKPDHDRTFTADYFIHTIDAQPTVNQWISCSERLPKYGTTVLITNDKGNVRCGRFRGVEFWKEDGDNHWTWKKNTIEHVLAWCELPEPYKSEDNE